RGLGAIVDSSRAEFTHEVEPGGVVVAQDQQMPGARGGDTLDAAIDLAAGLSLLVEDDRLQLELRRSDGSSQACRAGADDGEIVWSAHAVPKEPLATEVTEITEETG